MAYLMKFEMEISKLSEIYDKADSKSNDLFASAVNELSSSLDLTSKGYVSSECRDLINGKFDNDGTKVHITNRHLKLCLQKKYGVNVGFCSAYRRSDSKMLFSTDVSKGDLVKKIRCTDVVSECARLLRDESKNYNFSLDSSYCNSNDVCISRKTFLQDIHPRWDKFTRYLLDEVTISDEKQRTCDAVF